MSVPNAPNSFRYAKKQAKPKAEPKRELALKPFMSLGLFKAATSSLPRDMKSNESLMETQRALVRSIFGPDMRGADLYKVKLPLGAVTLTAVASVLASVVGVQSTSVVGFSEWAAVFSQYRITEADLEFVPYSHNDPSNRLQGVMAAGIDYGTNVTAAASFAAAQQFDDLRITRLTSPQRWHVSVAKGRGATDFIDVATNLVYATWKCYGDSSSVTTFSTNSYGVVCGYITLEFKGLQ